MQERRKDLADKLENGLKEMYASDKYADYLKTMSKFPRYSSRNVMLIHMQMPGASRVAAAGKWKSDFKRHPKKGEKAIYIYAPVKNDKEPEKKMMEKLDPETGAPMLDKDGKVIMEEMTALDMSGMRYRPVPVFDVSQTDGKALPEIVSPLNGDVERYDALLDALKAVSPLPIEFEKMSDNQDGYCRYGQKIGIREGMSERQTVAAIVHEIAHARLHDKANIPEGEAKKSRNVKELEAESVAFAICEKYDVNSGANSFGYLATWAGHDPEMKQLKASLDTIQKEVGSLSRELDAHYAAALKKRGLDKDGDAVLTQDTISAPEVNPRDLPGYSNEGVFIRQFAVLNNHVKEVSAELKANDVNFTFTEGYTDFLTFFVTPNEADAAKCGAALNKLNVENLFGLSEYDLRTRSEIAAEEEAAIYAGEREKALHDIGEEQLEPPAPFDSGTKEYSLGFGYTGSVNSPDGIEVWNWADEKPEGGYTVVANISSEREVTFIDENMPDSIKDEIFDKANTAVMQDEEQSECKFIPAANLPDGWRWQQWDDGSGGLQSPDDEAVVSYDLSTSEYKYKGEWNFMAGYPSDTESFADFKDSMEKRVRIDRGIDEAALSAEQEKIESPPLEIGGYVVTGTDALISGHGRITGLASDDYPGSNEHFIVDFGNAGTCTVHKDDMSAEIVAGYEIKQRIEKSDKEGVVLAHSPTAPDPYVTWRYIDRDGERDYYSGQYRQKEESALRDFNSRAEPGEPNVVVSVSLPEPEAPAPEPTMSTFPLYKGNLSDAVDRGETGTYHKSRQLNFLCRDTIDKAIGDNRQNIEGAPAGAGTYDMKAAVWSVIGECGRERAEWVLAANINSAVAVNDGRISSQNREWAENIGAPERHDYHMQAHKTLIDGFARRFRESEKEKPPMSFLYAQAQQRKNAAEAQKPGGNIEQSGHKKSEER